MADPRHQKLAKVIVQHSVEIKPGDKVGIFGSNAAAPLIRELYRQVLRTGAHPHVRLTLNDLQEIKMGEASDEQLRFVSDLSLQEIEYLDVTIHVWADENTKTMSRIDPKRMAMAQEAAAPVSERFMVRSASGELRWCGTLFPTNAHAQDAGMSLADYEDFVFGAGLLDHDDPPASWRRVHEEQQRVADYLMQHDEIHIVAPGTDITYRVGGRTWLNASGTKNFPDGEVFTGPVEDSANGTVRFTYPAVYNGQEVEDVLLTFRDGRVVDATAARNQEFLLAMLDMDPGARCLGEVAFGLNYGIQKFTRNILFDEKIGGTMHMALGRSYPETGGQNKSALHWDMICDLREGKVYADGELCYENGRFTI